MSVPSHIGFFEFYSGRYTRYDKGMETMRKAEVAIKLDAI